MCKGDNDGNSNNTITDREGDNSSRYKNDNGKNNHFNGNNPPETLMKAVIMTKR